MYASLCVNMRGPQLKTTLLLLLLTSLTGTVFCTEEEPTEAPEDVPVLEDTNDYDASPTSEPPPEEGDPSNPDPTEGTEEETDSGVSDQEEGNSGNSETTEAAREARHFNNFQDATSQPFPAADGTTEPDETEASGSGMGYGGGEPSTDAPNEDDGSGITMILIIAVVAVVLLGTIIGGILFYRQRNKKLINQELSKEDPYLDGSSTEKVPMPMFEEDVPSVQELEMDELGQWMKKDDS